MKLGTVHSLTRSQKGLTLLETLIASFLLLFILLSMITAYAFGRVNLDREEVKRKATAVCQNTLESVKARYARERPVSGDDAWDNIKPSNIDGTVVVDGKTFQVVSTVTPDDPSLLDVTYKTVVINVNWTTKRNNNTAVPRTVKATTTIAKIIGEPI